MTVRRFVRLMLAVMLLLATPVFAGKPEFQTINIDEEPVEVADCGDFTILAEGQGTIKISTHFDKNGDPVKEISRYKVVSTYTNSETGASFTSRAAGIDKVTYNADGSLTIVLVGRGEVMTPDGDLVTFRGRVVVDISADGDETMTFQGNTQELCALLD